LNNKQNREDRLENANTFNDIHNFAPGTGDKVKLIPQSQTGPYSVEGNIPMAPRTNWNDREMTLYENLDPNVTWVPDDWLFRDVMRLPPDPYWNTNSVPDNIMIMDFMDEDDPRTHLIYLDYVQWRPENFVPLNYLEMRKLPCLNGVQHRPGRMWEDYGLRIADDQLVREIIFEQMGCVM
jgi:hypothetical protein